MTRPAIGTKITIPANPTSYRTAPGMPAPLGYENRDGVLWQSAQTGTILRVRKSRGVFLCATSLGFTVRICEENAATYLGE
jgi:hypothetical protein